MWLILVAVLFAAGAQADSLDIDVPSNVANRSIAIQGRLFCGNKPYEGAKVRLFRVYQKNNIDDLAQLMNSVQTYSSGEFHIEANTIKFPKTQTEVEPYVTFHHACGLDEKQKANQGYKRWAVRLPNDYVTIGTRARKAYPFGVINLEVEYPGEIHDKKFNWNE